MDPFSGDVPIIDSGWWITLETLNPNRIPQPLEGLLKIDITLVRTFVQIDSLGNPNRLSESQRVRSLDLPGTMSRTQCSSAMKQWLHYHTALEADVANGFTRAVIEYVFQNHVDFRGKLSGHVAPQLEYVVYQEVEEEDVKKGLCPYCINLLRDKYVFLAAAEEGLGDCSICLEKLVPATGGSDKKKNYLFKSPCRHVFHDECMTEWLRNSDSCPLCRYVVSSELDQLVTDMDVD